jgi:very-short-patch-repair endonuclease
MYQSEAMIKRKLGGFGRKTLTQEDFIKRAINITVIEFDGQQHFEPVRFNGISKEAAFVNFKKIQQIDLLKTEYCKYNGISLLRIPYKKIKKIPEILESVFQ